ncbi:MAG: hypothetical protein E5X76_21250 [Mesorhizobium sp.]|nr:MAG: hypothetical protein E5X77_30855 [Mesorhizobium sp.]TJV70175.1 MAG: hypothetical protein E5X76_21250 [Mesorhizobium sp.]
MLPGIALPQAGVRNQSLLTILAQFNLMTGIGLILDAGDKNSAPSGATSWLDVSGAGSNFFLGTTSGADATDPTFNGTAGRLSDAEYFSGDGGDFFTYSATNLTWMNSLHKDNALFSGVFWFYPATLGGAIFGTLGSTATGIGVRYGFDSLGAATFYVNRAGGTTSLLYSTTNVITTNTWNFVGISINEATGAGGLIINTNGNTETATSTYSSPTTSNASFTLQLMAGGNNLIPLANGSRFGCCAMWQSRALTSAEITSIYSATRKRFKV